MGKRVILGLVGAVPGGLVGAFVGIFAGYAIAELVGVSSREAQAYFQMLVAMPAIGLLGAFAGAFALASIPEGRKPVLPALSLVGFVLVFATCGLGLHWNADSRPASFRVRNDASQALERVYMGPDFRRASRVGDVPPGTTTDYKRADLDEPGSFNAVRGRYADDNFTLSLDSEQLETLDAEKYTFVVSEGPDGLQLELMTDE